LEPEIGGNVPDLQLVDLRRQAVFRGAGGGPGGFLGSRNPKAQPTEHKTRN